MKHGSSLAKLLTLCLRPSSVFCATLEFVCTAAQSDRAKRANFLLISIVDPQTVEMCFESSQSSRQPRGGAPSKDRKFLPLRISSGDAIKIQ